MIEMLYDTATNQVRAWCLDPTQFGNLAPLPGQAVAVLDAVDPSGERGDYFYNGTDQPLIFVPETPDPDTVRAWEILATSTDAITQPEIWELLRIFGRRLGY